MALNKLELELCDNLADCWNKFLQLEILHPTERTEFMKAIHDAQHIVMARSAVREHKDKFRQTMVDSQLPKEISMGMGITNVKKEGNLITSFDLTEVSLIKSEAQPT